MADATRTSDGGVAFERELAYSMAIGRALGAVRQYPAGDGASREGRGHEHGALPKATPD